MQFISHFPPNINPTILLGLLIILGLLAGEIARLSRFIPTIFGYIIVGFLVGPHVLNLVDQTLVGNARIIVDISLGLILFELGRHLDFQWLRHDRSLLWMSIAESGLTFILIFCVLYFLGLTWLIAILAAIMAVVTSPAVVMMITHDLAAQGPVTRRVLILTSLNNFFGLVLFALFLPITHVNPASNSQVFLHACYRLIGSFILGFIMFWLTKSMAWLIGKRKENQFILFVSVIVLTISLALLFKLSAMLTVFVLGIASRNFDRNHLIMEVDFGWLARLFLMLLFVLTGLHLEPQGLWQTPLTVFGFIFVRTITKTTGIYLFAKLSRLTMNQIFCISLALLPMAGVALGMSNSLVDVNPELGYKLTTIITAVLAILNLLTPITTQYAFIKAGEAHTDKH